MVWRHTIYCVTWRKPKTIDLFTAWRHKTPLTYLWCDITLFTAWRDASLTYLWRDVTLFTCSSMTLQLAWHQSCCHVIWVVQELLHGETMLYGNLKSVWKREHPNLSLKTIDLNSSKCFLHLVACSVCHLSTKSKVRSFCTFASIPLSGYWSITNNLT